MTKIWNIRCMIAAVWAVFHFVRCSQSGDDFARAYKRAVEEDIQAIWSHEQQLNARGVRQVPDTDDHRLSETDQNWDISLQRSTRDIPNIREARFLDFYTCISSAGSLGVCLPQPYCSYMINGGILDSAPTRSCSHTMLSEYGCCTLPCSGASLSINEVPTRKIIAPQSQSLSKDAIASSFDLKPTLGDEAPVALPPTTTTATTTTTTTTTMTSTTSSSVILLSAPIMSSASDFSTCGKINLAFKDVPRTEPRDTQLAATGKWCWQVAIMDSSLTFKCGGTLLNNRHVLTVAHCVQKSPPSALLVRLGDTNLRSSDDNEDLIDVKVSDVIIHPDYTGQSPFQNNLAILKLASDVPKNRNRICTACLPSLMSDTSAIESLFLRGSPNGRCVTTGYGKLESQDEFPLMRMKEVPVPLIGNGQCTAVLQGMLGAKFVLPDTFVCAGSEGLSDGCEYDGGGPLVCPLSSDGRGAGSGTDISYVLTGVVTWGISCGQGNCVNKHTPRTPKGNLKGFCCSWDSGSLHKWLTNYRQPKR